jgi:hypothetical protein
MTGSGVTTREHESQTAVRGAVLTLGLMVGFVAGQLAPQVGDPLRADVTIGDSTAAPRLGLMDDHGTRLVSSGWVPGVQADGVALTPLDDYAGRHPDATLGR